MGYKSLVCEFAKIRISSWAVFLNIRNHDTCFVFMKKNGTVGVGSMEKFIIRASD